MEKSEIRTYADACRYLKAHGIVDVDNSPTYMRDSRAYLDALDLLIEEEARIHEPLFGVQAGTPDEMINRAKGDLTLALFRVYGRRSSDVL